ncbi:MAG: TolB family protein, partial [Actinomycetota bacterium]
IVWGIFAQDLAGGATRRVSVSSSGNQANSESRWPRLSDDARFVLFTSAASNLVADDTNPGYDFFVRDLVAGTTTQVSHPSSGTELSQRGSISSDGRFVAYSSTRTDLGSEAPAGTLQVFLHSLVTQTTILVSVSATGESGNNRSYSPSLSADGKLVAFQSQASNLVSGDTNGVSDIFVFERP